MQEVALLFECMLNKLDMYAKSRVILHKFKPQKTLQQHIAQQKANFDTKIGV